MGRKESGHTRVELLFGSGHNEAGPLLDLMKVLWLMLEVQVVKRVEAVCWTSPRLDRVGSFRGEPSSVENFLLIDGFLEYLHSITFYEILDDPDPMILVV